MIAPIFLFYVSGFHVLQSKLINSLLMLQYQETGEECLAAVAGMFSSKAKGNNFFRCQAKLTYAARLGEAGWGIILYRLTKKVFGAI